MIYFNSRYSRLKQRGITNLEVMFILVIAAVIILVSVRQYNSHMFQKNVTIIDSSVKLLFTASQKYFYATCADTTFSKADGTTINSVPFKTDTQFYPTYLSNKQVLQDPFNSTLDNYSANILWNKTSSRWYIRIQYMFPSTMSQELVYTYAGALGAKIEGNQIVSWSQNITTRGKSSQAALSPLSSDIENYSKEQTVKQGYSNFKPASSKDPCDFK